MTLADALAKVDAKLEAIAESLRADLIEQFSHATTEELAAILARHDKTCAEGQRRAREIVIGLYHSGTPGLH